MRLGWKGFLPFSIGFLIFVAGILVGTNGFFVALFFSCLMIKKTSAVFGARKIVELCNL
jgi:hypothetical protein